MKYYTPTVGDRLSGEWLGFDSNDTVEIKKIEGRLIHLESEQSGKVRSVLGEENEWKKAKMAYRPETEELFLNLKDIGLVRRLID